MNLRMSGRILIGRQNTERIGEIPGLTLSRREETASLVRSNANSTVKVTVSQKET